MNLSITNKHRWLVLLVITGVALGMISSGYGLWISLVAILLIAGTFLFKHPAPPRQNITTPSQTTAPGINKLEEMIKLIDQKDHGIITDAEYQERRADLIYNH